MVSPLNIGVPMVDPETGNPTPQFMQFWQEQLVVNATIPSDTAKLSSLMDGFSSAQGSILYRGSTSWSALTAGTARRVLMTNGPSSDPSWGQVRDTDLSLSDVTTNNVSTSRHGFAPKLPNDATQYLDGTGAYSVPAGGGGGNTGPLGFAKFTKPGDIFTTYNSGSPDQNAYVASRDTWRIQFTNNQGLSYALAPGLDSDGVVILRVQLYYVSDSFSSIGIAYGENSSGRRTNIVFSFGNEIRSQFYDNLSFQSESTITPAGKNAAAFADQPWVYFKMERSGTDIEVYISRDGLNWRDLYSGSTTENSMSDVDEVGLICNGNGLGSGTVWIECFGFDTSQQDEAGT